MIISVVTGIVVCLSVCKYLRSMYEHICRNGCMCVDVYVYNMRNPVSRISDNIYYVCVYVCMYVCMLVCVCVYK